MAKALKILEFFFFISISFVPFLPELGVVDIIAVQFLYLAGFQSVVFVYLSIQQHASVSFVNGLKNPLLLSFFLFIIISGLSILTAFNPTESLVEICRYFVIFITLFNFFTLIKRNPEFKNYVLFIFLALLTIESLYIFKIFLSVYSFESPPGRLREFQGFAYNQNVAAFSLLMKIPFIIYLAIQSNKMILRAFIYFIVSISFFDLLIIGSRGSLIAVSAVLFFLVFALFIKNQFFNSLQLKRVLFTVFGLFISMVSLQQFLYQNNSDLKSLNRVTNYNDSSVSYRVETYKEAIEGILDYPLLGVGIGNWKIKSLDYAHQRLKEYQVPYHVHNDFLHIGAEIGVLGLIVYLLIFILPLVFLIKKLVEKDKNSLLYFFIILSIMVYIADAMVNFPRARPNNQINFLYVFALVAVFMNDLDGIRRFTFKAIHVLFFVLLIPTIVVSYKVFDSYKIQKLLIFDFNEEPENYTVPLSYVETLDDRIPNITTVTFSTKSMKANYYLQEGQIEKAMALAEEGDKDNPYLGLKEHLFSKIYLNKIKNIDSAYKYAKLSHEKLPLNNGHTSYYQMVLAEMDKFEESKNLFYRVKSTKNEIVWQNFLIYNSLHKFKYKIAYDSIDKATIAEALLYFPENEFFKQNDKVINYGEDIILIANTFDAKAQKRYAEKDYVKAIENWEEAIKIIMNDDSYYLNIAQSYLQLNEMEKAMEYLNLIDNLGLRSRSGKYEYLTGLYYLYFKNGIKACNFFNQAMNLEYEGAKNALAKLGCS